MRWVRFVLGCTALAALGGLLAVKLGVYELTRLRQRVDQLEQERARLVEYAQRLSASRRLAQMEVLEQRTAPDGQVVTGLLWQSIQPSGLLDRPLRIEVQGTQVYVEALVLKFEHRHVAEADPQRGASLALFRRVFGDRQAPETAREFERAGPPVSAGSADPHAGLWARFWALVDDPKLAARYGVRVAQCEAPSVRVRPGQVWEVTIDAAGGLNLKHVADRQ